MEQNLIYRRVYIRDCSEQNEDFKTLFNIFRQTLKPDMRFREFKAYYTSARLERIDVTFILIDEKIIGFCSAAFYNAFINGKQYTIGRAATGILENYRSNNVLPKWKLYKKYMQHWVKHPIRPFMLTAYVANPLIYAMICKYTGIAYPKHSSTPPDNIVDVKNELLRSQNLASKEDPAFVVEIHFCVSIGEKEEERIFKSENRDVKYYLKINPKFRQQHGVLVIIPVSLKNITLSSSRFIYHRMHKLFTALNNIEAGLPRSRESNFT